MIVTLKQKQPGTGNIHDLESEYFDRVIDFKEVFLFAVVLPSYFGGVGVTRHKDEANTIKAYKKLTNQGYTNHVILNKYGEHVQYLDLIEAT